MDQVALGFVATSVAQELAQAFSVHKIFGPEGTIELMNKRDVS